MRVLLTSEARFERTGDGRIWGPAACSVALWMRYLEVFSAALVAARISDVRQPSAGMVQASAEHIDFCPLPPYSGLSGFLKHRRRMRRTVTDAVDACEAVLVRSPSPIANLTASAATTLKRAFGAEIVGDPDLVFSAGGYRHPLRVAIRRAAIAGQAQLSRHASAVIFVTKEFLQQKYPTRGQAFAASDVALDDAAFGRDRVRERRGSEPLTLITVAALDQPYKGTAVLLEALAELCRTASPIRLRIVGSGRLLPALQDQARLLGIARQVEFLGQLDQSGVRRALDSADLFAMPSIQEGLPRALVEAMARGLPAVATNVGGIPELLPAECLVPPRDASALARKILELSADDRARLALAERNRSVAHGYHERLLTPIRRSFLQAVQDATAAGRQRSTRA